MKAISRRIAAIEAALPPPPPEEFRIDGMTLGEIVDRLFEQERDDLFEAMGNLVTDCPTQDAEDVMSVLVSIAKERFEAGQIVVIERRDGHSYWAEMKERKLAGLPNWQDVSQFEEHLVLADEVRR